MHDLNPISKDLTDHEEILEKCKMTYRGNKEEICGVSISCLLLNQMDSQQVYHNMVITIDQAYSEAFLED
jgi:hypothetical protein